MTEIVKQQILSIRASGATNMFDTVTVQRLAFENGYYELTDYIENNRKAYAHFILTGETEETP
jgi:hypothetical protein